MHIQTNDQLRRHTAPALSHRLRVLWHRARGVRLGGRIHIARDVELSRYPKLIDLGDDCIIKKGAQLCPCREDASVKVGKRTTIGFYTTIFATSSIVVGDDCMIAPFCYIVDSDHGIKLGQPMNRQDNTSSPITIANDVWVGAHAVILSGARIGDGAVIAAGAVVRGEVPENAIFGGVPARKIGERK